ncbi:chaperonin 10-like protein [Elsinoe ampelina]|uniref:Chaperonin 10-like protein n=1 Tax=Elsinoe ampelina TaxID=302913 RepID=A0A6A6G3X4_9PEZI|nr:chaperonin 10-like protein [Elsinoe ampelina]
MSSHIVFRNSLRASYKDSTAREEPSPTAKHGGVVIKVKAVSLNYRDLGNSTREVPIPCKDDLIPVNDVCGIVHRVGEGVNGFEVGDHVLVTFDESHRVETGTGIVALIDTMEVLCLTRYLRRPENHVGGSG